MSDRNAVLQHLLERRIIAVIRMTDTSKLVQALEALRNGGVDCLEITLTVPDAIEMIKVGVRHFGAQALIGAGTVLDSETVRLAILAGAEFIVSPTLNPDVIKVTHRYDKVVIPGAFTPTEILTAWEMGADIVKVFPATTLGPKYFKDLKGPLPQVRLMPTGGITVENAGEFIEAGACCIGIGSNLLDQKAIKTNQFEILTEKAKELVANVNKLKL